MVNYFDPVYDGSISWYQEKFQQVKVASEQSKDPNILVTWNALETESHHKDPLKWTKGENYNM